jgi:diketogulonate reductase-like aldo/keto reductase
MQMQIVDMPKIGFGTYKLRNHAIKNVLPHVINAKYTMIDTAEIYKNQAEIGEFIKSCISRTSIWITTKVSFAAMKEGEKAIIKGIQKTFTDLQTDYVDLYLIHAPIKKTWLFVWHTLRDLQKAGKIRFVGVSNFTYDILKEFIELVGESEAKYIYCNQIEFNPWLNRKDLIELCFSNNIRVCAYGSLYKSNDTISSIAHVHKKTVAQILLRWAQLNKIHVIPTSNNPDFINENIDLAFDINIEYMDYMNNLHDGSSLYPKYL